METYPDIAIHQVIYQIKPYGQDMGRLSLKKGCSTVKAFLRETLSDDDAEVLYFNQDQNDYFILDSNTDEEDIVMKLPRTGRQESDQAPPRRQVKLRISYNRAPKIFDERAFFKEDGSMKSIHRRENEADFQGLRFPQKESLIKLRQTMRSTEESRFLVVMPTGVGKTVVMALAPFALNVSNKVLILTPTVLLKEQIARGIRKIYNKTTRDNLKAHPIGRTGGVEAVVTEYDGRSLGDGRCDIVVANVQQFAKEKNELYQRAKDHLSQIKIDVVLLDEGHHSAASSWQAVQEEISERNPDAKFVFVTATPRRTDGLQYGITDTSQLYLCKRRDAQTDKYIKETKLHPIPLSQDLVERSTNKRDKHELYSNQRYIKQIMEPAVKELLELRKTCRGAPLRMLVFARTNVNGKNLAEEINKLSMKNKWGLHAEDVKGSQREDTRSVHERFSCSREHFESFVKNHQRDAAGRPLPFVDIVVQVKLFGEGYDNPWIAVTAFVAPQFSLNSVAQGHGRALRAPPREMKDINSERKMEAHLFFPKIGNHERIVEDYMDGLDEDEASIVSPFYISGKNPLTSAHKHYLKMEREEGTQAAIEEMKRTAPQYHIVYRQRRRDWKSIPAEILATNIFRERIATPSARAGGAGTSSSPPRATAPTPFTLRLIDFGCGEDLLLEKKLHELVTVHDGTGHVKVLAVDVNEYFDNSLHGGDGIGTQGQLTFSHKGLACNYYELEEQEELTRWCEEQKADAAVFCLSFMLKDSFTEGLIAAVSVVKFGGPIYIVLDITKFGLNISLTRHVREKALEVWKGSFLEACGSKLQIVGKLSEKTDGMVYIELTNVSGESDRLSLTERLRISRTTLDSLRVEEDVINVIKDECRKRRASE